MELTNGFIHWVKECVTTSMFSVINGELEDYFSRKRGLSSPLSYPWYAKPLHHCRNIELVPAVSLITQVPKVQDLSCHFCRRYGPPLWVDMRLYLLKNVLQDFYDCAGLRPNLQKNYLFCWG